METGSQNTTKAFYSPQEASVDSLTNICSQSTSLKHYPLASDVMSNVLVYDGNRLRQSDNIAPFLNEFAFALQQGPGVIAIKRFYDDLSVIDEMSEVFEQILAAESGYGAGDHFGKQGPQANGRIWNVFQKSADIAPGVFVNYYKNPLLAAVATAWLGPHYQITAQVNIVRPGGAAQVCHRDYHLGFQQPEETARYPLHAQLMSAMLTLQGAIAHTDMPMESGPTKLLPYSQQMPLGYMAYHQRECQAYFEQHCVQVPLEKGDAVFFSPALFHAAGENRTTDFHRCANLMQISSVFGKPMESVDLAHISRQIYPFLAANWQNGTFSEKEKTAILTAASDGYSFPTNLDTDPPIGGLAPETSETLLKRALDEGMDTDTYATVLAQLLEKQRPR